MQVNAAECPERLMFNPHIQPRKKAEQERQRWQRHIDLKSGVTSRRTGYPNGSANSMNACTDTVQAEAAWSRRLRSKTDTIIVDRELQEVSLIIKMHPDE